MNKPITALAALLAAASLTLTACGQNTHTADTNTSFNGLS
jgi:predicted small secreted protein